MMAASRVVQLSSSDGQSYTTTYRITRRYVIIDGRLRFSRTTGKENANRRGKLTWKLTPESLAEVYTPPASEQNQ